MSINRKDFLKRAGSAALFSYLGISITSCNSSTGAEDEPSNSSEGFIRDGFVFTIDLTHPNFQALNQVGEMVISTAAGFLAVNVDGSTIRAFTNVCTHSRCSDQWSTSLTEFVCNCHGSKFDLSGSPTQGPATEDLTEFTTSISGNNLIIDKNT